MPLPPASHDRPRLSGHARLQSDPVSGRPLLLYPEGILELDETAAAILRLCDGSRSLAEIVQELVERYEGPPEEIGRDVLECLGTLADRGLVTLDPS